MSGREFRNVFENLRLRQRKSLGRSSLVNPNKPNAGAGYALRLSACASVLGKRRPHVVVIPFQKPMTVRSNCEPGTIRESSVGSDGKHCCGGKWPKRFYLLSAEILCKSGCRSSPFYGSFLRGTRPVQVRGLPPRPDDRIDRSVKNRQKAAFLLQREAGALSCCSELVYKRGAQRPCNE
jgi:hypothetical protein|nr:MAG TPA: hypothetical protein [Caudoviricetes sp.]